VAISVQEIVFSLDILLICGTCELTWLRMSTTLATLRQSFGLGKLDRSAHPVASIQKVVDLWVQTSNGDKLALPTYRFKDHIFDLVSDFLAYGCTDDRDRIFAVLALSYHNNAHMKIDYDLGVSETFAGLACVCMADGRLIDVLDASVARINVSSAIEVPSWAPDWTRKPGLFRNFPTYNHPREHMITYLSRVSENIIKLGVRQLSRDDFYKDAEATFPHLWDLCTEPFIFQTGSSYPTLRSVIRLYQKSDTNHERDSGSLSTLLQKLWVDPAGKDSWAHTYGNTLRKLINHIWHLSDESDKSDKYPGVGDVEFSSLAEGISCYSQDHCFFEARSSDKTNGYFAYGSAGLMKGDKLLLAERFNRALYRHKDHTYRGYVIRPDQSVQVSCVEVAGSYKIVGQAWLLYQTDVDWRVTEPWFRDMQPRPPIRIDPGEDTIYLS
jgi:hypothetical protein